MERSEIKETLIKSIDVATKEKGYTLARGVWGFNPSKCACILGCYMAANDLDIHQYSPILQEKFGVSEKWISDFVRGFDGAAEKSLYDQEAFDLGKELFEELKVPTYLELRVKAIEEAQKNNN